MIHLQFGFHAVLVSSRESPELNLQDISMTTSIQLRDKNDLCCLWETEGALAMGQRLLWCPRQWRLGAIHLHSWRGRNECRHQTWQFQPMHDPDLIRTHQHALLCFKHTLNGIDHKLQAATDSVQGPRCHRCVAGIDQKEMDRRHGWTHHKGWRCGKFNSSLNRTLQLERGKWVKALWIVQADRGHLFSFHL